MEQLARSNKRTTPPNCLMMIGLTLSAGTSGMPIRHRRGTGILLPGNRSTTRRPLELLQMRVEIMERQRKDKRAMFLRTRAASDDSFVESAKNRRRHKKLRCEKRMARSRLTSNDEAHNVALTLDYTCLISSQKKLDGMVARYQANGTA